jgi:hypothetical protein
VYLNDCEGKAVLYLIVFERNSCAVYMIICEGAGVPCMIMR